MFENILFPILILGPDKRDLELMKTKDQLICLSDLTIRSQKLLNCTIIDRAGDNYVIKKINRLNKFNPFWKFEFFNPMFYVSFDLEKTENNFNLEQLKKFAQSEVNKNRNYWTDITDKNFLLDKIKKANSIEDLMKVFVTDNYT
ncbi:MAG: hypothetical protein R3C61_10745 [Bacteroidia bacterium]